MARSKITDVAKLAGVGISTVSRVLNDSGYVSKETREKVLSAVAHYNYQPNSVARSLVQKSTRLVGVVISDVLNPFYSQLVRTIEETCDQYGYSVILCNSDENVIKESKSLRILLNKRVDGIIMAGGRGIGRKYNEHLFSAASEVHIVLANEFIEHEKIYCVCCDKKKGAYDMTNYLIGLKHREIVHIAGYSDYKPTRDRIEGFRSAMIEKDIPVNDENIIYSDYHASGGRAAVSELLKRSKLPTAIFASNDLMAIGAIKALQENDISVPGQIAVTGSDNISFGALMVPGLTTINHNVYELGQHSVSTLVKLIRGDNAPKKTMIDTQLIIRQSCGGGRQLFMT